MTDWDQFTRNVLYGLVHRPAQVLSWVGGKLTNEAAPVGAALQQFASEIDSGAFLALSPYVQAPGGLQGPPNPSQPPPSPPQWVKPQGSIFPWLSCPTGYTLKRVSPFIELPVYSCLLDGAPDTPPPPLGDLAA